MTGVERWGVVGKEACPRFGFGMFAVGGGTMLVRPGFLGVPVSACFRGPEDFPFGDGVLPYFFNSS